MKSSSQKRLAAECLALFYILPVLLYFIRSELAFRIFYLLLAGVVICLAILWRDSGFRMRQLWALPGFRQVQKIILVFIPLALFLILLTHLIASEKFLSFPESHPKIWLLFMVVYPLLLVWPQEMIFRVFYFHRYNSLFLGSPRALIFFNALSFGLAHIVYGNWIAPVLSFGGGLIFAWRYHATQSLVAVSLEHGLYGNLLFTTGLGWYFYSGAIQ